MGREPRSGVHRLLDARDDSGAVAVVVAISMVLLVGLAALVADVGLLYADRRQLQTAADAAALAGVLELPADPARARQVALAYVGDNSSGTVEVEVVFPAPDEIRVTVDDPDVPSLFAGVWGIAASDVTALATAKVQSPTAYGRGVMPFGILATGTIDPAAAYGYGWGELIRIKDCGGDGTTGNYGLVALTEKTDPSVVGDMWGNNDVRQAIEAGGVDHAVYMDSVYHTAPGNKATTTGSLGSYIAADYHSFEEVCPPPVAGVVHVVAAPGDVERCRRLILCPIIVSTEGDPYTWPTGAGTVRIIGFAEMFVVGVGAVGNAAYIDARFVRTVAQDALISGPVGSSGQVRYSLID